MVQLVIESPLTVQHHIERHFVESSMLVLYCTVLYGRTRVIGETALHDTNMMMGTRYSIQS
jgi:hypothetical protein